MVMLGDLICRMRDGEKNHMGTTREFRGEFQRMSEEMHTPTKPVQCGIGLRN